MTEPDDARRQEVIEQMTAALLAGRKLDAIKLYRGWMHCGLKEAKDEVEALTAQLRARSPELFPERKAGCAGALLLAGGVLGAGGLAMNHLLGG